MRSHAHPSLLVLLALLGAGPGRALAAGAPEETPPAAGPALAAVDLSPRLRPVAWAATGPVVLDGAEGAAPRAQVDPGVAAVLGFLPGFGLGHHLAGSGQWPIWTAADGLLFLVWPVGYAFGGSGAYALLGLVVLGERVVEGISAYQAAGGDPTVPVAGEGGRRPVMAAEVARPEAPAGTLALALGPAVL